MDTVFAETVSVEIVIVFVIVLLSFWSLNEFGQLFETICCFTGIPGCHVVNEELGADKLFSVFVNVFNMYAKVSEFDAELEHQTQRHIFQKGNKSKIIKVSVSLRFVIAFFLLSL